MHSDNHAVTPAVPKAPTEPDAVASLAVPAENFNKAEFNCALKPVDVRFNEKNQTDCRAPIRRTPM